eukprot:FR736263.1.p1 GENE.FR736263.1~~FR736263.1.p1  ORF type:complete len:108 (+),score=10.53 FR736263.1:34-324(+)
MADSPVITLTGLGPGLDQRLKEQQLRHLQEAEQTETMLPSLPSKFRTMEADPFPTVVPPSPGRGDTLSSEVAASLGRLNAQLDDIEKNQTGSIFSG